MKFGSTMHHILYSMFLSAPMYPSLCFWCLHNRHRVELKSKQKIHSKNRVASTQLPSTLLFHQPKTVAYHSAKGNGPHYLRQGRTPKLTVHEVWVTADRTISSLLFYTRPKGIGQILCTVPIVSSHIFSITSSWSTICPFLSPFPGTSSFCLRSSTQDWCGT